MPTQSQTNRLMTQAARFERRLDRAPASGGAVQLKVCRASQGLRQWRGIALGNPIATARR